MKKFALMLILAASVWEVHAETKLFREIDTSTGEITYTNYFPKKRPIAVHTASTPAVVTAPVATVTPEPQLAQNTALINHYAARKTTPSEGFLKTALNFTSSRQSNYLHIEPETQRERDHERHKIIASELQTEESDLHEAASKNASADIIQRHQSNIIALRREISRFR